MRGLSKQDQVDVFHYGLKLALEQCDIDDVPDELRPFVEDQYKSPTGFHRRRQSSYPSSFTKSKSFGGVAGDKVEKSKPKSDLDNKLGKAISEEQQVIKNSGAYIAPRRGQFIIDGKIVISNHADLLKALVGWMIDNNLDVLQHAISDIRKQIESGAIYANVKTVNRPGENDE